MTTEENFLYTVVLNHEMNNEREVVLLACLVRVNYLVLKLYIIINKSTY